MISGEKVCIKGITKESTQEIYKWVNIEQLRSLTGTVYPVSEYEHEEWIKRQVTSSDRKLFLISDKETDVNIGTIGLKNIDWINRNAELYISIGNYPQTGAGYGTDAVKTMITYCFRSLNLHKIYLHVFETNTRAINSYKKSGMVQEGILKDHHFQNGRYENVIVMSIINDN